MTAGRSRCRTSTVGTRSRELEQPPELRLLEVEIAGVEDVLDERLGARLERSVAAHDRNVGILGPLDDIAERGGRLSRDAVEVEAWPASQRQRAVVRHEHRRAPLDAVAGGAKLGAAADALGLVGIDVRVVEQTEPELVAQQATCRLVDPRLRDAACADEFDEQLRQRLATELVAPGVDDLHEAILRAQLLDAPALGAEDRSVRHRRVRDQPPVGADDTVEAVAVAQEAGDDVAVETEADLLERHPDRASVVRHDLRRPGFESGFEHP